METGTDHLSRKPPAPAGEGPQPSLSDAIQLWVDKTTTPGSMRRADLARDKRRAVLDFFAFARKSPADVSPQDVRAWQAHLETRGLRPGTVYVRTSYLSSFYAWAMRELMPGAHLTANPVRLARPRAPRAYQSESVKSLTDDELQALVRAVRRIAAAGGVAGKRDYALLLLYVVTGMRRQEIISLRGRDVEIDEVLTLTCQGRGGECRRREVNDPEAKAALLDYLSAADRLDAVGTEVPLWTRHDGAGRPLAPLTSHAFAKNLKCYARAAGLGRINLHQTRHTFARIVAEETGSLAAIQAALGHRNRAGTSAYVRRIGVEATARPRRATKPRCG